MNPDNYGSRETCQRLVEAGIVMETEAEWFCDYGKNNWKQISAEEYYTKILSDTARVTKSIPAPSMAEAWRELPEGTTLQKWALGYQAWIAPDYEKYHSQNTNPTDTLIELRIWLEERKEGT